MAQINLNNRNVSLESTREQARSMYRRLQDKLRLELGDDYDTYVKICDENQSLHQFDICAQQTSQKRRLTIEFINYHATPNSHDFLKQFLGFTFEVARFKIKEYITGNFETLREMAKKSPTVNETLLLVNPTLHK